ncbi:MAG: cell division protein FtsH [Candidatus Thermofonsia Clade 1 bacterium]|uniref:ATP-dependent zinc metalloprotease FtsH n=1 Tax=Candidatus Thermofonsia Clade 1 bacterium TaxID=2364210 RepID=A0A2M8PGG6_9CHLR|nr:MAG: cell division protein FtsH [Candidatus Thermofonsia Clade 1 bacterium]
MNNSRFRNLFIWILIGIALVAIFLGVRGSGSSANELKLSELAQQIISGTPRITSIVVVQNEVRVTYAGSNRSPAISRKDPSMPLPEQLISLGVPPEQVARLPIEYAQPNDITPFFSVLISLLPIILIAGFFFLMLRQAQGSNNQAISFGKSRARMFTGDRPSVTFDDVAGADEAKEELREIVEFLKEPDKFIQLGARIPKGVLLVGSPGTGKTLLAKAVAGEAGVPFFSISGSEFVEMFVGVGASRVRDLFDQAKRHSPCIIFIDEIDAVGRHRGAGLGGSHDEREQTLNQILVEMDGFDTDTNVIVIAATNRPDILDPALMRPGRFDRRVVLDRPDVKGREAILRVHTRGKPLAADVDLAVLSRTTPGFVGADLENLMNEAAILAARKNKKSISMRDCEEAIYRVILGPERKSRVISEEQKRLIAYHEAGHAIVGHFLPNCDPVRKITIVPRGMSGGSVLSVPEDDMGPETRSRIKDAIAQALGGRAAEQIIFGEVTTGAGGGNGSDLATVTRYARAMVTRFGMSDRLGPMIFGQKEEMVFLGREIAEQRDYSEAVAQIIDEEVKKIVDEAYQRALNVLTEHREELERVAQRLMEVETIDYEEFMQLMGETPVPNRRKRPEMLPKPAEKPAAQREQRDDLPPRIGTAASPA